jgi:hypothetical protein
MIPYTMKDVAEMGSPPMKSRIAVSRSNIIALIVFAVISIALTVAAYFFPEAMGLQTRPFLSNSADCNSPLFYPDASDRRGVRPACGTSY